MAIVVEHDKRRHDILEKALDVFTEEGYEDATFQKIADRCGITRTTLYIYFKNKREIFVWSIKQMTELLEAELGNVIEDVSLSPTERLKKTLRVLLIYFCNDARLFNVILSYLMQVAKTGKDTTAIVKKRTIRLRHILSTVIIDGINAGEFRRVDVKAANDMLYSYVESIIFEMAVFKKPESDMAGVVDLLVRSLVVDSSQNVKLQPDAAL